MPESPLLLQREPPVATAVFNRSAAMAAALYDTEDFHAGVEAFLSKQPLPPFRGR